ncbi:hypothetical protein RND71_037350 [Anisodus tanguticus]|uniref:RNase H type-1 domain-containing protein n=1 Tax=Anisodus tanguticus TaxID=243964 RepID=A0AAE1R3I4_9SOLA|nr:hypothetical protein RND71_037350 [Anisodus tanguticus]
MKIAFPYVHWHSSWVDICSRVEICSHEINITRVCWTRPDLGIAKLNTDGSSFGNPGKIGAGGILRDSYGELIYAFAASLGDGTNNQAELEAACIGLSWCIANGYL